jgi:hypothetical protein
MGSLALWRGVEGVGKGMGQLAEQRMADESYEKRAGIDEARAQRLEKLKQEHTLEVTGVQQEGAMERQVAGDEAAMSRTEVQQRAMDERAAADRESRERTTAMTGESRETVERMGIAAGKYDKVGSGASDPRFKAIVDKYEAKTLTVSQASELNPSNPLFNVDKDTPAIYDGTTWYLQQGDKYVLPDTEPKLPAKRAEAEAWVLEDPMGRGTTYRQTYGYLPVGYFDRLRNQELAAAGYDPYGNKLATE